MRKFVLDLRIDDSNPEAVEIMQKAMMMAAKHVFTTAALIAGKRKPMVKLFTGDMFVNEEEINLADDIE